MHLRVAKAFLLQLFIFEVALLFPNEFLDELVFVDLSDDFIALLVLVLLILINTFEQPRAMFHRRHWLASNLHAKQGHSQGDRLTDGGSITYLQSFFCAHLFLL